MSLNNIVQKTILYCAILLAGVLFCAGLYQYSYIKATNGLDEEVQLANQYYRAAVGKATDPNLLVSSGSRQLKSGQIEFALICLKRATELEPKYRDAWVWLGAAQMQKGNLSGSVDSLKKAAELDPVNLDTFQLLASAYKQLGDGENSVIAEARIKAILNK